jgi:hypothetical protein
MFPCSGCGLCCQNISNINELVSFDLGNGMCKYFNPLLKHCEIYDTRPEICRVDEMYNIQYYRNFTKEEFYIKNANACNALQEQYKVNKSFRVSIKE